jgi:hypothetical protein
LQDWEKPKLVAADRWLAKQQRVDRGHRPPNAGRD